METIRRLLLMAGLSLFSMTAYGGKTYGSIGATANGSYVPLPAATMITITGHDMSINYKLRKSGWYDLNIPKRGKFKVTCKWNGQEYVGFLLSASGPQRYNVHLKKKE